MNHLDDDMYTFLIVRRNIPLILGQYANLRYTPETYFLTDSKKQVRFTKICLLYFVGYL